MQSFKLNFVWWVVFVTIIVRNLAKRKVMLPCLQLCWFQGFSHFMLFLFYLLLLLIKCCWFSRGSRVLGPVMTRGAPRRLGIICSLARRSCWLYRWLSIANLWSLIWRNVWVPSDAAQRVNFLTVFSFQRIHLLRFGHQSVLYLLKVLG
jgi:hypothetical protein